MSPQTMLAQARSRPIRRRIVVWGRATALVAALALLVSAWVVLRSIRQYHYFDDGPFAGAPVELPRGHPSSRVSSGNLVIECYNRPGAQPIVASRWTNRQPPRAWEITTDLTEKRVYECELARMRATKQGYEVWGNVVWTYGRERAVFYFDKDGRLLSFYLSW